MLVSRSGKKESESERREEGVWSIAAASKPIRTFMNGKRTLKHGKKRRMRRCKRKERHD